MQPHDQHKDVHDKIIRCCINVIFFLSIYIYNTFRYDVDVVNSTDLVLRPFR